VSFTILVSVAQAQERYVQRVIFGGTQFNWANHYKPIQSKFSIHIGMGQNHYVKTKELERQNIKNLKFITSYSISVDRFYESDFYKYAQSNDEINYTKVSLNADIALNILEWNWPNYTSFFTQAGVLLSPYFSAESRINGEVFRKKLWLTPFNMRFGFGIHSYITDELSLALSYSYLLLSDFKYSPSNVAKWVKRFINQHPNVLNSVTLTFRFHLGWH
jgi:hypothetical protein